MELRDQKVSAEAQNIVHHILSFQIYYIPALVGYYLYIFKT